MKYLFIYFPFFILLTAGGSAAQEPRQQPVDFQDLIRDIKNADGLNVLNDLRVRLRNIEFNKLPSLEQKENYAEAYRLLAFSHRNHRYIRPGYEIYLKYLSLHDTLNRIRERAALDSVSSRYNAMTSSIQSEIKQQSELKKKLEEERDYLNRTRSSYAVFRIITTLAIVCIFLFLFLRLKRKLKSEQHQKLQLREKLTRLADSMVQGQITAAVIYHSGILNERIVEEAKSVKEKINVIADETGETKSTESIFRSIRENLSRINKLAEINESALHEFLKKIPVFRLKREPQEKQPG